MELDKFNQLRANSQNVTASQELSNSIKAQYLALLEKLHPIKEIVSSYSESVLWSTMALIDDNQVRHEVGKEFCEIGQEELWKLIDNTKVDSHYWAHDHLFHEITFHKNPILSESYLSPAFQVEVLTREGTQKFSITQGGFIVYPDDFPYDNEEFTFALERFIYSRVN